MCAGCFGCTFVPPGYVGVKIDLYGHQRGVQDYPIVTGRVFYNPWTTNIDIYPTFIQYRSWVQSKDEGKPLDESIRFVSSDKIPIDVDVSIAYKFLPNKVPYLYVEYRTDPDTLADTYIRARVRSAFSMEGAKMKAMDVLGGGVTTLNTNVEALIHDEMAQQGIVFDYVNVMGQPRVPSSIQNAINAAIQSTQQAQQAMNQVAVRKAEADQAVAVATGEANAIKAKADGDAYQVLTVASAQAKSNQLLASSLTPELVQLKAIEKWSGDVPTWQTGGGSGAMPFVNIQPAKP
jgi:regulator of protease activity HflC (stomatin/prohibitin superfamily)